jgi:hypothetical protein
VLSTHRVARGGLKRADAEGISMSRHETLRGIYGARAGGSAAKRPLVAASKSVVVVKRPERPSTCRGRTPGRNNPRVAETTEPNAASCETTEEGTEAYEQRVEGASNSNNNSFVDKSREPGQAETLNSHPDASTDGQQGVDVSRDKVDHVPQRRHVKSSSVLSFYGDGFLEVRLKPECQQLMASPSEGLEWGGFTIELLVFKAADVAKPMKIM